MDALVGGRVVIESEAGAGAMLDHARVRRRFLEVVPWNRYARQLREQVG